MSYETKTVLLHMEELGQDLKDDSTNYQAAVPNSNKITSVYSYCLDQDYHDATLGPPTPYRHINTYQYRPQRWIWPKPNHFLESTKQLKTNSDTATSPTPFGPHTKISYSDVRFKDVKYSLSHKYLLLKL